MPKIMKEGLRPGYNNAYSENPAIYASPDFEYVTGYD